MVNGLHIAWQQFYFQHQQYLLQDIQATYGIRLVEKMSKDTL